MDRIDEILLRISVIGAWLFTPVMAFFEFTELTMLGCTVILANTYVLEKNK